MPENNVTNFETRKPLSPEEIEALKAIQQVKQEAAGEFLDAHQIGPDTKPFRTEYSKAELAHQVKEQFLGDVKPDASHIDEETGLHPREAEKLKKNPLGWINETIGGGLSPHEQVVGLTEAIENNDLQNNELKNAA